RDEKRPVADRLDQRPRDFGTHGRAAPAAAEPPLRRNHRLRYVARAVQDDGAVARAIVEAGLQPREAQREAVRAFVGILGSEDAETRLVASRKIGEILGRVFAAAPSVRDALAEQNAARSDVDDEQTLLRRRARIVDHRED